MALDSRKITLGMTGGIACYKVPYLVRALIADRARVQVIMTRAACEFIAPLTLETVSGREVAVDTFERGRFVGTRHIDLAQECDLLVIAPATANFLGKAANGIADDLLSTVFCASDKPALIAPAMNPYMWNNRSVQRNVDYLRELGHHFVGPDTGEMACEASGVGRMSEPERIHRAVVELLSATKTKGLSGKQVIVTAGPSREAIDPVRYISNHSSGKMGFAIASAAVAAGAQVTLVTGPTSLTPPPGAKVMQITTTEELSKAVRAEFGQADCLIMAAAPADYRPVDAGQEKIRRGAAPLELKLQPTPDILRSVAETKRPEQVVVGFALETGDGLASAQRKLREKHLDLIVLNETGPGRAFDSDTNEITLVTPDMQTEAWPQASKSELARRLIERIAQILAKRS